MQSLPEICHAISIAGHFITRHRVPLGKWQLEMCFEIRVGMRRDVLSREIH